MSNQFNHGRKWLLSRLKTSGSKRGYITNGSFAGERSRKNADTFDQLPKFESMGRSSQFYNGKVNYSLLKRFLGTQIGADWDEVYQQVQARIPTRLKQYEQVLYWFVADQIDLIDHKAFDRREQKFLNFEIAYIPDMIYKDFVVSPLDNRLYRFREFGETLHAGLS